MQKMHISPAVKNSVVLQMQTVSKGKTSAEKATVNPTNAL